MEREGGEPPTFITKFTPMVVSAYQRTSCRTPSVRSQSRTCPCHTPQLRLLNSPCTADSGLDTLQQTWPLTQSTHRNKMAIRTQPTGVGCAVPIYFILICEVIVDLVSYVLFYNNDNNNSEAL